MGTLKSYIEEARKLLEVSTLRTPWSGFYAPMPPQISTTRTPTTGFPFHTKAAEKVFKVAEKKSVLYPELNAQQILQQSIHDAEVGPHELTPEDAQLLDMAIRYFIDGPEGKTPVIGGAPGGKGGPARTSASRFGSKGAP